ncbi:MAG TPA: hypothetical protein VF751_09665 [Chthoniobacterales bacterium]
MKTVALAALFVIGAAAMGEAKTRSTFRVDAEASASNGPSFSTTRRLFGREVSDGKIYIASGLTANDVALLKKDWPTRK